MQTKIINADSMEHLKTLDENIFDSCVTDPPYHLASIVKRFGPGQKGINNQDEKEGRNGPYHRAATGFMGQTWDGGDIAFQKEFWDEVYRVMKPGAYLLAFAATRNYHRLGVAIEDAGFEIRDMINWIYGSGFPKSHNIGKQMDKKLGNTRQVVGKIPNHRTTDDLYKFGTHKQDGILTKGNTEWEGWGTALKPAHEPIVMARKPIDGSVVDNILEHRTGAINIDESRVPYKDENDRSGWHTTGADGSKGYMGTGTFKIRKISAEEIKERTKDGRYPANVIHDGSDEVIESFSQHTKAGKYKGEGSKSGGIWHKSTGKPAGVEYGDEGSVARYFYSAKANKKEKGDSKHPTVKPLSLMRYLVKLVTPKEGLVLDPFAGTGTTGEACILENRKYYLIEKTKEYIPDIENRLNKYGRLGI